jgi:spore coat protein JB
MDVVKCTDNQGTLQQCAPLSVGFVPMQQANPNKYDANLGLTRGTLFPGLDLPFMNIANKDNPYAGTPLGELMAIDFTIIELTLYLDTHKNDAEAFDMLKSMIKLSKEGRQKFSEKYGPISIPDLADAKKYTWTDDPWPWEFTERTGKK